MAGTNIDEVQHKRALSSLPTQNIEIELVLQTRNAQDLQDVVERLNGGGFLSHVHWAASRERARASVG